VFAIDTQGRLTYVSEAVSRYGYRPDEVIGQPFEKFLIGADVASALRGFNDALEDKPKSLELSVLDRQGHAHIVRTTARPLIQDGQLTGVSGVCIDLTAQRQVEQQLLVAQRMEAVGRLAGGVAHDFNNLLTVITNCTSLVLEQFTRDDPMRADLQEVAKAAEHAAKLTRQLLAFSRRQVFELEILDLNQVVCGMDKMLRRLIGEDIELGVELAPDLGNVSVDRGQIEQVLMNLVVNSRDALPTGGAVKMCTHNVNVGEADVTEHGVPQPGPYVVLEVTDNGCGMAEATKARIFEPFFTTKEVGKGTGLGLATVFGIVQQCGGNIWVYSEPGNGTTFRIYLPQADEVEPSSHEVIVPMTLEGTETILLVEDQDEVRQVALHILRRYGYHVIEARNAGEALLTCERHPRAIHLLLTDVVMPQMNGRELAERLLKIRPDMRVLYMSGYTEDAIVRHGVLDSGIAYLQKPFEPEKLARRVREVLEARPRNSMNAPNT
jgi:two-component system, cell cycle sensor histidine kinase and response regulator CckA